MDERQEQGLRELVGGRIRFHCPMGPYTTLGVGGEAEALIETGEVEEIQRIVGFLHGEGIPWMPVGRGSNLLVTEEGLEGVVLHLTGSFVGAVTEAPGRILLAADAGVGLAELTAYCRRHGLSGLEFLAGIPGTVGGAVAMNAGAWGRETGDTLMDIRAVERTGRVDSRSRSTLRFLYRRLDLKEGDVIVSARWSLAPDAQNAVAARMAGYLKRRRKTQPLEFPSAGSVFKNPPGDFAGRLIEQAGLKGKRIGDAMISIKHANFIVNVGRARAGEVLELLRLARDRVAEISGIVLEPEIRVVGR
jgi:UDP-N-acetylmuramate dehydrogenase